MANTSTNLHEHRSNTFWDILATDRQTNRQTDRETNKQTEDNNVINLRLQTFNTYIFYLLKNVMFLFLPQLEGLFKRYPQSGSGTRSRDQIIETIRSNIQWRIDNEQAIEDWLDVVNNKK